MAVRGYDFAPCKTLAYKILVVNSNISPICINPGPQMYQRSGVRQHHLVTYFFQKDVLALIETGLRPRDTVTCIANISPSCYNCHHRPRSVGRGGSVGILLSDHIKVYSHSILVYSIFLSICVELSYSSFLVYCVCQSRPPETASFFQTDMVC